MSGTATLEILRGDVTGLAVGVSWLDDTVLAEHAGTTRDPAEALVRIALDLSLDFAFVPAEKPWASDAAVRLLEAGVTPVWAVEGVFGRVARQRGWVEALADTVRAPGSLAADLDRALHAALDSARRGIHIGCEALLIADDLAGDHTWLVGPDFALDALVPCYRRFAAAVVEAGAVALFHSDGDIRALVPALSRAGFSAVHAAGVDEDALGALWRAARETGVRVVGGVAARELGCDPTALGRRAGEMALAGGLLVCDDGGMTTGSQLVAYAAELGAARHAFSGE